MADSTVPQKRKPVHKTLGPPLTLPKLKKIKRDLLTDLPLRSHECQSEILPLVRKSFHWTTSVRTYEFKRVQSVHNPDLTAKYLEKRRDMKSCGYSDSLVSDTFAFLPVENMAVVDKICRNGVRCGNQNFSGLGVSHMAVHLCKHADILSPSKPTPGDKICLAVKVIKGKVKSVVCRNVGVQLEPTPNYDCHIAKPNSDQSQCLPSHLLFYSLQLYIYEYGDLGVEEYPKQVLPYAVVHYTIKELQTIPPHIPSHPPYMQAIVPGPRKTTAAGPKNEIWRGRLHLRLIGGGHIYIDVSIFSHFVPLTVTLMSPVKIHNMYPNNNAQFTYFAGLSDIANKPEVPWREHFFRSFFMKPTASSEEHFKALVLHISRKQEMATIRLPKDVYLFMMPKCLLASQLGLSQGDDNSSVLYCVLMSKFSTIETQKKKLKKLVGRKTVRKFGKATSWEELFDDSDDDEQISRNDRILPGPSALSAMFEQQRPIHNRLASMSGAEINANFSPCGCNRYPAEASECKSRRNMDVHRIISSIHSQLSNRHSSKPRFPPGSRRRPKQRVSRHARAMPSFSPHGSSESDSDTESRDRKHNSRNERKHLSILDSNKTVEEELSEEELTNEQMEAIIFMRKPATTALAKPSSSSSSQSSHSHKLSNKVNEPDSKTNFMSTPVLRTKPKIIPVEPISDIDSDNGSPITEDATISSPVIIPTEPVSSPVLKPQSPPPKLENSKSTKVPKSILKKSSSATIMSPSVSPPQNLSASVSQSHPWKSTSPPKNLPPLIPSLRKFPSPPRNVSASISPPRNVSASASPPRNVSASMSPPRNVSASMSPPRNVSAPMSPPSNLPSLSIDIPMSSSRNVPMSQSPPRNVPMSQSPPRNVPMLVSPSRNVPVSVSPPRSVPMSESPPRNLPMSLSPPRNLPSPPRNTLASMSPTRNLIVSMSPPRGLPAQIVPDMSQPLLAHQNDMGDIDMRIPPFQAGLSLPFSAPASPPQNVNITQPSPISPNLSLGSWLVPGEMPPPLYGNFPSVSEMSFPHSPSLSQQVVPSSPDASPPSNSPPSPCPFSPGVTSPPRDSPPSPPSSPLAPESESPASPPQSSIIAGLRSTPIAIPTIRLNSSDSPRAEDERTIVRFPRSRSSHREEFENADDMNEFLNSAVTSFDSDSPFEDDR